MHNQQVTKTLYPSDTAREDLPHIVTLSKLIPLQTISHGETMEPNPPQGLHGECVQTSISSHPAFDEDATNHSPPSTTHGELTSKLRIENIHSSSYDSDRLSSKTEVAAKGNSAKDTSQSLSNTSASVTILEDYADDDYGECAFDLFEEAFPLDELLSSGSNEDSSVVSSHIVGRYLDCSKNVQCPQAHSPSSSSSIESCHSKHDAPSLTFDMDSSCPSSASAFNFTSSCHDLLKLLNKASCCEILTKVLILKSEIVLQHASLETPSLYYEDNILELEKPLEHSFRSVTNKECNDDEVKSLIQPKRLFEEDNAVTPHVI